MRVYCTGRHSEPHPPLEVKCNGLVYECPECRYDVSLAGVGEQIEEAVDRDIELHHLAQLVNRARTR